MISQSLRNVRANFNFLTPEDVKQKRSDLSSSLLSSDIERRCGDLKSRPPLLRLLKEREVGETSDTLSRQCLSSTHLVPNSCIQNINSSSRSERAYNVSWSKSGNFCVAAWQDESVRVYIERPALEDEKKDDRKVQQSLETSTKRAQWRETARVQARNVAWTVTAVDISPDESAIAYSTISSEVHILRLDVLKRLAESNDTEEEEEDSYNFSYSSAATPKLPTSPSASRTAYHSDTSSRSFSGASTSASMMGSTLGPAEHGVESHIAVEFTKEDEGADHSRNVSGQSGTGAENRRRGFRYDFGIFSVKFSIGGSELVAGCNDGFIRIMDLSRALVSDKVQAHKDDINSVCFAGGAGEAADVVVSGSDEVGTPLKVWDRRILHSPVSVLLGHQSGITHVSPRGDGRTILSVSKDQTIKLWDLRKVSSNAAISSASETRWKHFDYRFEANPSIFKHNLHPNDCSINTFYGPVVLQTLIKANFSPLETTGGRFICSGSADGCVYIYDVLTGEVVDRLSGHKAVVRDVSWHPSKSLIASASWDGIVKMWSFDSNISERLGAKLWEKEKELFLRTKNDSHEEESDDEEEDGDGEDFDDYVNEEDEDEDEDEEGDEDEDEEEEEDN